jgi:hypothetical protein
MTLYCELGFHTNKKDCDEFIHEPEIVGMALAKGICKYLGVTFKEPVKKTCNVTLPILKKGDSGEAVKAMQNLLIAHGHSCGDKGADGFYGESTKNALHAFKEDNGLKVTDSCGVQTWSALLGAE